MPQLEITPASQADQSILFDLYRKLFQHHIEQIWSWDDEWQIENFQREWLEVETRLIRLDGQLAGYSQTRSDPDGVYLLNLGIDPKYQNCGIGTKVIENLQEKAQAENAAISLNVFRTNQRVVSFYQNLGFQIQKTTETGLSLRWRSD